MTCVRLFACCGIEVGAFRPIDLAQCLSLCARLVYGERRDEKRCRNTDTLRQGAVLTYSVKLRSPMEVQYSSKLFLNFEEKIMQFVMLTLYITTLVLL